MALTEGTNCGFCASAPTADPGAGTETVIDNRNWLSKFTTPAGCTTISELGFYIMSTTHSAVAYKIAIYTHNSGSDAPQDLVGSIQTGQNLTGSTAGWYKYTGLNISVSESTIYWLGVEVADSSNDAKTWRDTETDGRIGGADPLSDPISNFSAFDNGVSCAFYAKYDSGEVVYLTPARAQIPA